MTEEEEFEFRSRLESEQTATPATLPRRETTTAGLISEAFKGAGRGATALPNAIASGAAPPILRVIPPEMRLQENPQVRAVWQKLLEQLKPAPQASATEQMLGTGAELATAMSPFAKGSAAQRLLNIAAPTVGGVAGEQVGGETGKLIGTLAAPFGQAALSRMLAPRASSEAQMLYEAGVRATPGQSLGGALNKFEKLPLIREMTASSRQRAIDQFNQATLNRVIAPIGGKVDKIGFEGFAQAESQASAAYDKLLPQLRIKADLADPFWKDLNQIGKSIPTSAARQKVVEIFNSAVTPYLTQPGVAKGSLNPQNFKTVDSELGRLARQYGSDPMAESRHIADALRETQMALRDMVARQNPQHSSALDAANKAWAGLIRVEEATKAAGKTDGVFSAAQFQQAVKKMDSTLRHRGFAAGRAMMQDWSNAGIKVLGSDPNPHVPYAVLKNVGLIPAAAGGMALGGPIGTGLALGAGAMYGLYNPASQAFTSALTAARRPGWVQAIGNALRPQQPPPAIGAVPLFSSEEE